MNNLPVVRSPWRIAILVIGFTFLYAPMLMLVIYSFNSSKLVTVWAGWSTRWYSELFPDRYYIELQENTLAEQDLVNKRLMEVAATLQLPLVATNDCHYLRKDDREAHDVLLCIQTGKTVDDENRMRYEPRNFYLRSTEEMEELFGPQPDYPDDAVL